MQATRLSILDVILLTPKVFGDARGLFFESFNEQNFQELTGLKVNFVQDNHSKSQKGVLRGLHYQLPSKTQAKLAGVVQGEVFDVAVDIRKSSPSFGKWIGQLLSTENNQQVWILEGFAHGFVTLADTAEFLYKTTSYYVSDYKRCIAWNDSNIGIRWRYAESPGLSGKDKLGVDLHKAEVFV